MCRLPVECVKINYVELPLNVHVRLLNAFERIESHRTAYSNTIRVGGPANVKLIRILHVIMNGKTNG